MTALPNIKNPLSKPYKMLAAHSLDRTKTDLAALAHLRLAPHCQPVKPLLREPCNCARQG